MDVKPHRKQKFRGQTLVEFALVVPIMLLVLFAIIEIARLLHAWVTIENGARFGVRYAVTGDFQNVYCTGYPGGICDDQTERDGARIPSIHDAALSGAAGIWRDPAAPQGTKGYLKITVCSNKTGVVYFPPDPGSTTDANCLPGEDAGGPGDRVSVTLDFDHPIISPLISSWLPKIRLTARREGIVEQFRVSRVIGLPATISVPTFTPTQTPTPTLTPTMTTTAMPTDTPTPTLTPCKVPPVISIIRPSPGDLFGKEGEHKLPGYAQAYDPDNPDPLTCSGVGADGEGILEVEFQFFWWDGS
ncbi:MAG: TadE/TadG family type IV pilus assembly protein, partial [Anaerolineales bacterium]